jgi:hypothetical protein
MDLMRMQTTHFIFNLGNPAREEGIAHTNPVNKTGVCDSIQFIISLNLIKFITHLPGGSRADKKR